MVPIVQQNDFIAHWSSTSLWFINNATDNRKDTHTLKDSRRKDCETGIDNTYHSHGSNHFSAQSI